MNVPIALGIDHGVARIGLAASDALGMFAHPVATVDARAADHLEQIAALARRRGATRLVIGLPLRADGSEGPAAERVREFAEALHAVLPELPICWEDESYTTVSAAAKLRASGRKARQSKGLIDQAAAVEILQAWLDRQPH